MFKEFYFLGKYTELKSSKFIFDKEIEADGFRVSIAEDGSVVGRYHILSETCKMKGVY